VGENDKEKSFSRFTTMEVDDESKYKSGLSTPVEISEKSEESITLGEDGLRRWRNFMVMWIEGINATIIEFD
jgi:hypothetical protein